MNIVRQDRVERAQRYDVWISKDNGFEMIYEEFEFPSELDRRDGESKRRLWIQERRTNKVKDEYNSGEISYWQDTIYERINGEIEHERGLGPGALGTSPALEKFAEMSEEHRAKIRGSLSPEALDLLNQGLAVYSEASYSVKKPRPLARHLGGMPCYGTEAR